MQFVSKKPFGKIFLIPHSTPAGKISALWAGLLYANARLCRLKFFLYAPNANSAYAGSLVRTLVRSERYEEKQFYYKNATALFFHAYFYIRFCNICTFG